MERRFSYRLLRLHFALYLFIIIIIIKLFTVGVYIDMKLSYTNYIQYYKG